MRFIRRFRMQAKLLLTRSTAEDDLTDELQDYVERQTERHIANGLPPADARLAALREVGGVEQVKEECRDARPFRILETFLQDLRYGIRQLRKNPGFTLAVVLTLALGIGANSTIFSAVSSILLREPPIESPDRVVTLLSGNSYASPATNERNRLPVSVPDFLDWRDQASSFVGIAASSLQQFTLGGDLQPERVPGAKVTANYFRLMGVALILGRYFTPTEDQVGHDRVALIRDDLWKGRFGADPRVIGRTVKVDGEPYTVIGIIPSDFRMWFFPAQIWVPLTFTAAQLEPKARDSRVLTVLGRLKPGIAASTANAEMTTISRRLATAHPETLQGRAAQLMTLQKYLVAQSNSKAALLFLQGTVVFVLLIACANIINLMLARNTARQREFAIRIALGGGTFRLACQLFAECLLLSLIGAVLGLAFALWGIGLIRAEFNWSEYAALIGEQLSIDRTVLLFTLVISLLTSVVFALVPALQVSRRRPNSTLQEHSRTTTSGRERNRVQKLLVIAELAGSVILLVGAGIFVSEFLHELHREPGLNPQNVLTASVQLNGAGYATQAQQKTFSQNVLRQIATSPEVISAAITSDLPFTFPDSVRIAVEGKPVPSWEKQEHTAHFAVSPGYFKATQIRLRQGREFTSFDTVGSAPVVIVNAAFAEKFFLGQNPLGHHVRLGRGDSATDGDAAEWSEIVGIAGNVDEYLGQEHPHPQLFECFLQQPQKSMKLFVRLRTNPDTFAAMLRQAVWSVDRSQPVTDLKTMNRVIQNAGQGDNLMAGLMTAFAGIALVMAVFGIYGLIGYLVARRTQEIGIRMAIGASQSQVLMMVLRDAMPLALLGIGAGFLVSLGLPSLTAALFNGMNLHSGWIVWGTPLAVAFVALASCYLPAHKASTVAPLVALRNE